MPLATIKMSLGASNNEAVVDIGAGSDSLCDDRSAVGLIGDEVSMSSFIQRPTVIKSAATDDSSLWPRHKDSHAFPRINVASGSVWALVWSTNSVSTLLLQIRTSSFRLVFIIQTPVLKNIRILHPQQKHYKSTHVHLVFKFPEIWQSVTSLKYITMLHQRQVTCDNTLSVCHQNNKTKSAHH